LGSILRRAFHAAFTGRHWNTKVPTQASMNITRKVIQEMINRCKISIAHWVKWGGKFEMQTLYHFLWTNLSRKKPTDIFTLEIATTRSQLW